MTNFWKYTFLAVGLCVLTVLVAFPLSGWAGKETHDAEIERDVAERLPQTPIVIPAGQPIVIGVSAALTGPNKSLGLDCRNSVVVGIERWKTANDSRIKGHDIEMYVEDDGCAEADMAILAAERLISNKSLVGVIGPICSAGAQAAIPVYAEAGVVMISGTATRTDLTLEQTEPKFFFRTVYTNAAEGILQARYVMSQLNAATAYVIDDTEAYGYDLAGAVQQALEERGRQVTRESILPGAVDFSELTARIASDNPDVVIFEGFNPEGALLYRQLRDTGYGGPFVSSDGVASVSDFIGQLGEQAEGAAFAGGMPTLPEEFLADYIKIIGSGPTTPFAAHVADAVNILLDAVAQVALVQEDGSLQIDPLELREAVSNPRLLIGVSGIIAFDGNGDRVGNAETIGLVMVQVENGEFIVLSQ